eukprot:TRINITY_DN31731_c0_g1_i1.p1 TRINITY_DN31731_c0_g1~~TRINITY_DN31731_c0_g1_i1.p1  ORF type:complete len:207 (-),score=11.50 TRINITY_DN31731_c0_g1_i1:145-696(-)
MGLDLRCCLERWRCSASLSLLLAVALLSEAPLVAGCNWKVTEGTRCGYSCGADVFIGNGGKHYDVGVSYAIVDSCLERCRLAPACNGVYFAAEGTEDSGGPGKVEVYSGTCYYKVKTSCGVECKEKPAQKCFTLQEPRHEGLDCPWLPAQQCRVGVLSGGVRKAGGCSAWLLLPTILLFTVLI